MNETHGAKKATVQIGQEAQMTIERIPAGEGEVETIRFTVTSQGETRRPINMTEKELMALMQAAIREHILSQEFLAGLQSEIEI